MNWVIIGFIEEMEKVAFPKINPRLARAGKIGATAATLGAAGGAGVALLKNILKKRRMKKQRASAIDAGFTPEELAFYYGDTPFLYGQPYAGG